MSESVPSSIGPYRVIRRLGGGGMGEVFLAHDPRLERRVAIKRIRAETGFDPVRRARFLREARLAASLNHPSIVQVFDLLEEDETAYIVMEYVPGPALHEMLQSGPLDLAEGLRIAVAVAEGLAYAHRRGILHRDLKAENVLLTPEGLAKIADFGIARRILVASGDETLTREGAVLGTPRIMAPEQACGDPVDARSDLFSFGILLYEVFGGRSPFLGESNTETLRRILSHHPPPLHEVRPGLPRNLSDLIAHLLEKEPALRPRQAAEVAGALRSLAVSTSGDGGETLLPPTLAEGHRPTPTPSPPPARDSSGGRLYAAATGRRGWRRAAMAALGLSAAAAGGALFLSRPPAGAPPAPVSVAVLAPRLSGGPPTEETRYLAFALRGALQNGLTRLEGVFPKSETEVDAVPGTPVQKAHALAADEILETRFACRNRSCTVEIARLRAEDGAATWSGTTEVPLEGPLTAARAVAVLLRQAYGGRDLRPGLSDLRVSPRDYAEYLDILRAVTSKPGAETERAIERLESLRRRSPELVEAYLLEATIQTNSFLKTRDPAGLDRALALLGRAQSLAPANPEVWFARAQTEIQVGRLAEAEVTLDAFERSAPGDVRVLDLRALLTERQGRPEEALALYRQAVEREPAWGRLYGLANLAWRQGDVATARQSLETLLERFPANDPAQHLLASLELAEGDPRRAASLYTQIALRQPSHGSLANLGVARLLLGDIAGASAALEKASAAAPDNYFYLLNLGQVRWLQGRRQEARDLLGRALALSDQDPSRGDWQRLTVRAQALAHLGRSREAVAEAQEALRLAPQNGQVAFEVSLVFAVVGDRTAALVNAERAHGLGFNGPAWFRLPWFNPLRADPDFRRLAGID